MILREYTRTYSGLKWIWAFYIDSTGLYGEIGLSAEPWLRFNNYASLGRPRKDEEGRYMTQVHWSWEESSEPKGYNGRFACSFYPLVEEDSILIRGTERRSD